MARAISLVKARRIFKGRLLFGMVFKPVRLFCEYCDKYIPGDMEWQCGYCPAQNTATKFYSFLNKCRTCKRAPKAVVCPHCGELNYLDKDEDGSYPASSVSVPIPPQTKDEIRRQRREERLDEKEDVEHQILIAGLKADLQKAIASGKPPEMKTAAERIRAAWQERKATAFEVDSILAEQLAENAIKFKDNPELREKHDTFVKDFADDMRA